MWINFKLLEQKGMTPQDLLMLQAIKQNKGEDLSRVILELGGRDEYLSSLVDMKVLKVVKGKKSDALQKLVRLDVAGEGLLEDVTTALVEEQDLILFQWLEKIYRSQGKEIGNRKKGKRFLAQFRAESGITGNNLAILCKAFLDDDSAAQWSQKLEYLFFKAPNVFTVKFDLGESKLYNYYLKHKEYFDQIFEQR